MSAFDATAEQLSLLTLEQRHDLSHNTDDNRAHWYSKGINLAVAASLLRERSQLAQFVIWNLARMGAKGWHGLSLRQIGDALDLKREHVANLRRRACDRLWLDCWTTGPGKRGYTLPGLFVVLHQTDEVRIDWASRHATDLPARPARCSPPSEHQCSPPSEQFGPNCSPPSEHPSTGESRRLVTGEPASKPAERNVRIEEMQTAFARFEPGALT